MARKTKDSNLESDQTLVLTEQVQAQADETDYDEHNRSRCGGALLTARESQGLSIQDIATRLRLSPKQITALEADNFAALPEPTIVRGFIRNYAKQLKINAEPLLDAYNVMMPNAALHELVVKPSANMKMTGYKKPNTGRYLLLGLATLLALGVWLFYQNYIAKPSPTELSEMAIDETNAGENAASVEPLPEAALPIAERVPALPAAGQDVALQPSAELNLPAPTAAIAPASTELPTIALPAAAPNQLVVPASVATAAAVPTAPAAPISNGMAKLVFNANQETWVSVVDASGREVYNKIIFAGSRDTVDVKPPVNVTVGNAGATNLTMNGKPIELGPHMRGNVARVKLN